MTKTLFSTVAAVLVCCGMALADGTELLSNGTIVTAVGTGPNGGDLSVVQEGLNINGFGTNVDSQNACADDFTVPCGVTWTLNSAKFYVYQTGADPLGPSTITAAYVAIFDGKPGAPGTSMIWGDLLTDRKISSSYVSGAAPGTFLYRINSQRAVQEVTVNLAGSPVLGDAARPKTYWIAFSTRGAIPASGPFMPPITPNRLSDNAVGTSSFAATGAWPTLDGDNTTGTIEPQDLPFKLSGTASGTPCPPPDTLPLAVPGDGSWGVATAALEAGAVKFYSISIPAITTGSRLDIDTIGSVLTGPSFSPLGVDDTFVALFRPDGTLLPSDDDDGPGLTSQLTIGTPLLYGQGDGLNYDGRDGAALPAGNYVVAVCAAGRGQRALPGFDVITDSDATGEVTLRVRVLQNIQPLSGDALPGLIDVGTPAADQATNYAVPMEAGVTSWVKLTIPTDIDTDSGLDIYTEGSQLQPVNDCSLALYRANGNRVAIDFDSGSGSLGLLSFGGGFRQRIGTSYNFFGQDGQTLPAGNYYLAVVAGDTATFGGSSFNVINGGADNAGPVSLTVRYRTDTTGDAGTVPVVAAGRDFGVLQAGTATLATVLESEQIAFFRIEVPASATAASALVIDTEGSELTPFNDTAMRLYDSAGISEVFGGSELDQGSLYLSQLSYGDGMVVLRTPALARRANGDSGEMPLAGVYYLAVRGGNNGQGASPDWNMNSNAINSGLLRVNVRYVADTTVIASESPTPSAEIETLGGTLTRSVALAAGDVAWMSFTFPAGAVSGTDWLDIDTETSFFTTDPFLGLYDSFGQRVATDNNSGPGLMAQMSFGMTVAPATGREPLPGGVLRNGYSGELQPGGVYWVAVTAQDGTGVNFGSSGWNAVTNNASAFGTLVNVNFRSSFPPLAPPCLSDMNRDGTVDGSDFIDFINSFAIGDVTVDPVADVAGGTNQGLPAGGPDGTIDGTDFIEFINAFSIGC
jgi:hypothetical protein